MKPIRVINAMLLMGLLSGTDSALAAGQADMTFRGTLMIPPPCTINDGRRVDIDFGERIGIKKVDGVNYRQPVNYQITCKGETSSWVLKLSLSGTASRFDANALQTNKEGLGIRMYQNNKPFTPNTTLSISKDNHPKLEVVPVKQAGATLEKGSFVAWATLRADYQ